MKIGVTGTREGACDKQLFEIIDFFETLKGTDVELHHGDCTGVDIEVAALARAYNWKIVCHPPVKTETQGFFGGDEVREPKGYLERDRNIVDSTDLLLVVPLQTEWQPKGGTWYTHDYAKKKGKPVMLFWPGETNEQLL